MEYIIVDVLVSVNVPMGVVQIVLEHILSVPQMSDEMAEVVQVAPQDHFQALSSGQGVDIPELPVKEKVMEIVRSVHGSAYLFAIDQRGHLGSCAARVAEKKIGFTLCR